MEYKLNPEFKYMTEKRQSWTTGMLSSW